MIESHPWQPFIPSGARYLFLGTFPPQPHRWSMPFYYPNPNNDFWRVMGVVFFADANHFWDADARCFRMQQIIDFLTEKHIAMGDTAQRVRRLRDNASDKFLEIVEPLDLNQLLLENPSITTIIATGEKAAATIVGDSQVPAIGVPTPLHRGGRDVTLLRMPSTSRAYPLPLAKKAATYATIFQGS